MTVPLTVGALAAAAALWLAGWPWAALFVVVLAALSLRRWRPEPLRDGERTLPLEERRQVFAPSGRAVSLLWGSLPLRG